MAITAAEVNKLRQETGAGMMDCKNALVEANGDFEAAIDILRKKGQKVAAKRADRASNEGRVVAKISADNQFGAIVMINCETDFVAKNGEFVAFVDSIIDAAMAHKIKTKDQLMTLPINGRTVTDLLTDMTGKTGEKVECGGYSSIEQPYVISYNHNGNRLATIVGYNKVFDNIKVVAYDIAMQIAAMNPIAIDEKSIPQDVIDHELNLAREIIRQEGKPENMVEKIAQGKLHKFFKENTLLDQEYIKGENKETVAQYMAKNDKDLQCTQFVRLQLGA